MKKSKTKDPLLVFMGLGASGKTTYANTLVGKYGSTFVCVSSGDIVRKIHNNLSDVERDADIEVINKYGLSKYNDEIREQIDHEIERNGDAGIHVILDGYPRTVQQFIDLTNGGHDLIIVKFNIHMIIALERMRKRNREEDLGTDCVSVLKAQMRQLKLINDFMKDFEESAVGYRIPILELDNNNDNTNREGITYAIETIKNYYCFYRNIYLENARCLRAV